MKTILLALDFSPASEPATAWAKLFARHYNAELVLVHVAAMPMPSPSIPAIGGAGLGMGMTMGEGMPINTDAIFEDRLAELGQQLQEEGIRCQTDMRRGGIDNAILEAAKDHRADLIVTGRSHIGNFFDRLAGTVASDIARGAHCPVLIVPSENMEVATKIAVSLRTIVFSTSLEFDETRVFGQVVELARTLDAALRLLHVESENQPNITSNDEILTPMQTVYGAEPLGVDTVASNTVTGGMEKYLNTHVVDLLVMTTRERGFLSGLLNPSLTSRMAVRSEVPLLVYQAEGDL